VSLIIQLLLIFGARAEIYSTDMLKEFKAQNCEPILKVRDYFVGQGVISLVEDKVNPEKGIQISWCKEVDKDNFILVSVPGGIFKDCPTRVDSQERYKLLSLYFQKDRKFKKLHSVDGKTVVEDFTQVHQSLLSTYDDTGGEYICHDGKWFVQARH
jgi:hypothetical protein